MNDAFNNAANFFNPQNNPFMNGDFAKFSNTAKSSIDPSAVMSSMKFDYEGALKNFTSNVEAIFKANSYAAEGMRAAMLAQAELLKALMDRSSSVVRDFPVSSDVGMQMAHGTRHVHGAVEEVVERMSAANQALVQASENLTTVLNKRMSETFEEVRRSAEEMAKTASGATEPLHTSARTVEAKVSRKN